MKIKEHCKNCAYYQRRKYSQIHYPANYHAVGFSYAYAYCTKHNCRCADVKSCDVSKKG